VKYYTGASLFAAEREWRDDLRVARVGTRRTRIHDYIVELILRTRFHHREPNSQWTASLATTPTDGAPHSDHICSTTAQIKTEYTILRHY